MPTYDKPTWRLIQDALDELPELFTFQTLVNWFRAKYPKLKETGIRTHVIGMTVNGSSGRYYPRLRPHAVLYRVKRNQYTRYDPERHGQVDIYGRREGTGGMARPTPADVAQKLLELDPRDWLHALAQAFNYERGDLPLALFACSRERGHLTKDELVWLVDWKTAGRQRKNAENNSEKDVEEATRTALQTAVANPTGAVQALARLEGVRVAVASAVLTAWDPQTFGIIDKWAWQALHTATGDDRFDRKSRTVFLLKEYASYLDVLRELKEHTRMSCHDLDKALWVLGKAT